MASVTAQRGRLYLLAKVPRRDGKPGLAQTRIALRLDDTAVNRRVAAKQLQTLERQLEQGTFGWAYWQDEQEQGITWREAISRLHRARVLLGRTSESTWEINYLGRLRQINPASACTSDSMAAALGRYDRSSCSYKELFYLLRHLSRLVAVPFPEVPLPTYSQAELVAVPTDAEIISWVEGSGPASWYFGMMATYGLRPHEIEGAALIDRDYCQVQEQSKTGFRTVVPLPREWVERFRLHDRRLRPTLQGAAHDRPDMVAKWLSKELAKQSLPWRPYALRHAYAGRLWREGGSRLDIYTAARLMGHTPTQHAKTYRAHIQPHAVAEAAERALAAPAPPSPDSPAPSAG
jgi:integrase